MNFFIIFSFYVLCFNTVREAPFLSAATITPRAHALKVGADRTNPSEVAVCGQRLIYPQQSRQQSAGTDDDGGGGVHQPGILTALDGP